MRKRIKVGLGAAGLLALGMGPAYGDIAPQKNDIVGVGGDTVQYQGDFLADGSPLGAAGYNSGGNANRLFSFDATADANGRAAYANGSTEAAPIGLNATVVLRAGKNPVQRTQSSGDAITALLNDNTTGTSETINYVRSASLPNQAQQDQATSGTDSAFGGLRVVQFGTDTVQVVAATTTNAPAGLSNAELKNIYNGTYTKWSDIPGYTGPGGSAPIVAEIPPTTSSVTKTFLAAIGVSTPASSVITVEQNDPSAVTSANAIVPFSTNRLALYTSGYFHNPGTKFPGSSTALTPGVTALTGTAPDGGPASSSSLSLYIIFRNVDALSTTPWQPGGLKNWAQELFIYKGSSRPFLDSPSGQADIAAAGSAPSYNDLGNTAHS